MPAGPLNLGFGKRLGPPNLGSCRHTPGTKSATKTFHTYVPVVIFLFSISFHFTHRLTKPLLTRTPKNSLGSHKILFDSKILLAFKVFWWWFLLNNFFCFLFFNIVCSPVTLTIAMELLLFLALKTVETSGTRASWAKGLHVWGLFVLWVRHQSSGYQDLSDLWAQ